MSDLHEAGKLHPLTGEPWRDDVKRQQEFEVAHPGTEISCDLRANPLRPWAGLMPGMSAPATGATLGGLLGTLERVAALIARDRDLQRLKDAWGDVCDSIGYDAGAWTARLRGSSRELPAPSAAVLDDVIRTAVENGAVS